MGKRSHPVPDDDCDLPGRDRAKAVVPLAAALAGLALPAALFLLLNPTGEQASAATPARPIRIAIAEPWTRPIVSLADRMFDSHMTMPTTANAVSSALAVRTLVIISMRSVLSAG